METNRSSGADRRAGGPAESSTAGRPLSLYDARDYFVVAGIAGVAAGAGEATGFAPLREEPGGGSIRTARTVPR
jgi:hypothetical protein